MRGGINASGPSIAVTTAAKLPDNPTPTLKEQGINLELLNWRSVVAAPGITADQKKALSDVIEKMAKSKEWQEILKQKGWDDAYLGEPAFGALETMRHRPEDFWNASWVE